MKCFGEHGMRPLCPECEYREACAKIHRHDKMVARSNRRYALLKLSCERADEMGLDKSAPLYETESGSYC